MLGFFGGEDARLSLKTFLRVFATVSGALAPWLASLVAVVWLLALAKKITNAQRLDRQTSITSIRDLSWQEFEQLLAEAFRRQGYRVRDTGSGADGGVDLILDKNSRQTLVQAKQWKAGKVGVKVVRELLGVQTAQQADASVLVTSGHFTEEARRFAAANGVTLIDGETLTPMIAAVQRSPRVEPKQQK